MIGGFEPIVDCNCEILILGSMPGVESIKKQEYYGNKRNHFWKIVFTLFGGEASDNYEEKKKFLRNNHIAVWDVVKSCDREGSSDSNIKNSVPNDFKWLFENYPQIKNVYFNGKKAQELYRKLVLGNVKSEHIFFTSLPSSSPANTITFEQKLGDWKVILERIEFVSEPPSGRQ